MKLQYESYKGDLINLKYFIKVNIIKSLRTFSYEEEFAVIKPCNIDILKKNDEPISMQVGVKDLLSILIELNHINYSIHGTLKGSVSFGKVNLLITKMEIQLIKKETIYGPHTNNNTKKKIVASYELIDGGPYKNETIPFRFFLSPYNLTPTYKDISSYFSTRYYLNLVIKDQENNRYFKQKEIFLYRLYINNKKNLNGFKDFITEPIDYGDYFSSFNDTETKDEKDYENIKEPEESDFYFKSNLKGFISEENDEEEKNNEINNIYSFNEDNNDIINHKNRSNSVYEINRNINFLNIDYDNNDNIINNDDDYIINDNLNNYKDDNDIIENKKKNKSVSNDKKNKNNKNEKNKNQVINIKEKNKYKNNDILINDNYYNIDNYIIYENSYKNVNDNKLMQKRINKTNVENNNNENNDEEKKEEINKKPKKINNDKDDIQLYFPDEPFSNSLIINNFPSNYNNIGDDIKDFRKNLMGERIKK